MNCTGCQRRRKVLRDGKCIDCWEHEAETLNARAKADAKLNSKTLDLVDALLARLTELEREVQRITKEMR